jgi:hypothetical protein
MTSIATKSKQDQLVEALVTGGEFTAKQITAKFGIANPTAVISDLRLRVGYAVYANKRVNETETRYRLGRPSRKVVAAGYRAIAAGL